MDRSISVEDRIRRAEEVYQRRNCKTESIKHVTNKKNTTKIYRYKIFRKMLIQLVLASCIYAGVYTIKNNNYVFSQDFINRTNEILNYTIDFNQIIVNLKEQKTNKEVKEEINKNEEIKQTEKIEEQISKETGIGGAEEDIAVITPEEQKIIDIKNITSFIAPVQAKITSPFGSRDSRGGTIPANHTGIDFGVYEGTGVVSATTGKVILVSNDGDFGTHVKIQKGDIIVIYAHCKEILVNVGEEIEQGQKIAISGNTGKSTGPHLHFEIRYKDEPINPTMLIGL